MGGGEPRQLGPGDVLEVPRDTAHAMWNAGDVPAEVVWSTSPPGRTEEWWGVLEGLTAAGRAPGLRTMAGPLLEYGDVFRLTVAPQWLLRPVFASVRALSGGRR